MSRLVPHLNWYYQLDSLACPFHEGIQKGQKWIVAQSKEQQGYKIQNAIRLKNYFHPILYLRWMAKVLRKSVKALDFTLGGIQQLRGSILTQFWPPPPLEWTSVDILHTPPCPRGQKGQEKQVNTKFTLEITFRSMELIKNIASMKIFKGHKNIISKKEVLNNCRF